MRYYDLFISVLYALLCTPLIMLSVVPLHAQVRQSTTYQIESDSINFGGGFSSSTNYSLESTAGEIGTGNASSTSYNLRAGYQQMTTRFISISAPDAVTMSPTLVGITGGESNGSTTVTVTTDSAAGYALTIASLQSPSLVSGADFISDYTTSGAPDYTFTTISDQSHFGYSPSGIDIVQRFKDDGVSACNTGSAETSLVCWDGLRTTPESIAQSSAGNAPDGATTTIHFKVGIGGGVNQAPGIYVATTTLTAVSL